MKRILCLALLLAGLVLASCSSLMFWKERDDFIRARGTRLFHNERPYYFAGTNMWHGCYLGSPGPTGDRERLLRELDTLKANGVVNLRVLAASEESYIRRSVQPAIQRSPGVCDDSLLQGLDFLLAAMADRHMHAVLYLNNYWEWSGGMAQYNAWASGGRGVDPDDSSGYAAFIEYSATFYANPKANALYREYVRSLISRRNSENGLLYRDDPTIMAWQLANEPRPGGEGPAGEQNLPLFYDWIDETAAYIHSLDTNHLVSTGSEGMMGCLRSAEYFLASHRSDNIDYLTFHLWPLNWGWFDPERIEETLPSTVRNAQEYVGLHIGLARQLGRPIVMEEFGLGRDGGKTEAGTPTTARDRYYGLIYSWLCDSARAGAPIAGSNFWTWGGEERGREPGWVWREGDPLVGDPPQEAQGLNSVFIADRSTLAVIRAHAFTMLRLGTADSILARAER